jgi:hypothetical protein
MQLQLCGFDKGARICAGEKTAFSTNGAGKTEYLPVDE